MLFLKKLRFVLLLIFTSGILIINAIPCDSCGNECASACGTKHFRTCCFNYLRKRTDPVAEKFFNSKRLIDFILLQGHALLTKNELSRDRDDRLKQNCRTMQRNRTEFSGSGEPRMNYDDDNNDY